MHPFIQFSRTDGGNGRINTLLFHMMNSNMNGGVAKLITELHLSRNNIDCGHKPKRYVSRLVSKVAVRMCVCVDVFFFYKWA